MNYNFSLNSVRTMINVFCDRSDGLNICHLNARSIRPKIDELREIFRCPKLHAILVSESWLHSDIPSSMVAMPGYKIFRNDVDGSGVV